MKSYQAAVLWESEKSGDENEPLSSLPSSVRPFVIMFSQLYNVLIAESALAKFP